MAFSTIKLLVPSRARNLLESYSPSLLFHRGNLQEAKLVEVGRLESVRKHGETYTTGQMFIHKVFGYRGVILFSWQAKVFNRDLPHKPKSKSGGATPNVKESAEDIIKGTKQTFYQALIDSRDAPHISAQTEAVTFLGNQEGNRTLYAIPGLDYLSHDDVVPYTTRERLPLHHELFEKFLIHLPNKQPSFNARDTLKAWQKKNHPWLVLSEVHKETTYNIRVTVIPFYMGSRPNTQGIPVHWWRYCVRIENLGGKSVQLKERSWRVFSLNGTLETIRGRGVIGQEPSLSKKSPAFQYGGHISLQSPSGHMWGSFRMEREDGFSFDCRVPPFSLQSKRVDEIEKT